MTTDYKIKNTEVRLLKNDSFSYKLSFNNVQGDQIFLLAPLSPALPEPVVQVVVVNGSGWSSPVTSVSVELNDYLKSCKC